MRPKLTFLLIIVVLTLSFGSTEAADEQSHRAAIERLLKAMKVEQSYEIGLLSGFEMGIGLSSDRVAQLPEEQRAMFKKAVEKVKARMVELAGWNNVKAEMINLFMKHFTAKEAEDVAKMIETPTGQLLVTKQLALLPDSMKIGQGVAQRMQPEITKIFQEEMKE